uniref:(California timema) hypothetical protein n=1 Tax=Timema californicum TaxID=61474 RepID=A0A7R9J7A1_TIMCA|nr:unnamed protein product [Timema californicum]
MPGMCGELSSLIVYVIYIDGLRPLACVLDVWYYPTDHLSVPRVRYFQGQYMFQERSKEWAPRDMAVHFETLRVARVSSRGRQETVESIGDFLCQQVVVKSFAHIGDGQDTTRQFLTSPFSSSSLKNSFNWPPSRIDSWPTADKWFSIVTTSCRGRLISLESFLMVSGIPGLLNVSKIIVRSDIPLLGLASPVKSIIQLNRNLYAPPDPVDNGYEKLFGPRVIVTNESFQRQVQVYRIVGERRQYDIPGLEHVFRVLPSRYDLEKGIVVRVLALHDGGHPFKVRVEHLDLLVTLSTLLRGSIYEKLRWTFKLYDINGDGCITRSELGEIVVAIHELMGRKPHQVEEDRKAREQVDRVFNKLDLNQDGVITIEEFIESCLKVPYHFSAMSGRDDHKVPPSAGLSLWTMIQGQSSPAPVLSSATTTPRGFRGCAALRGMSHGRRVGCRVLKELQECLPKGVEH